ncbi:MAG: thioredoxin domain-containing protein, partial [Hyphomicrobiaceae bacterium]
MTIDSAFKALAFLSRRAALAIGLAAVMVPTIAMAQKSDKEIAAELAKPLPHGELVLGKADAPVTITEYASLTCSHCAHFHNTVLPDLEKKYIDTGKVKLLLREFPLDNLAAAASMLSRCTDKDNGIKLLKALFKRQDEWAFVQGNPVPALFKIAKEFGFTKESFDKCLTNQKLLDDITNERDRASKILGVRATPTFFVN